MIGGNKFELRRQPATSSRLAPMLTLLLVLSLLLASCIGPKEKPVLEPTQELARSPLVTATAQTADSPLPTATRAATATLVPTFTPLPSATPMPTPAPGQLVVLHTNDNWGETEPCG